MRKPRLHPGSTYMLSRPEQSSVSTSIITRSGELCKKLLLRKPALRPGRVRAHQRVTQFRAQKLDLFTHSRAGIRAVQTCSKLPRSSVSHGASFISVKANLAVESFATSLIRQHSVPVRVAVPPHQLSSPRPQAQWLCLGLAALGCRAKICFLALQEKQKYPRHSIGSLSKYRKWLLK